MSRARPCRRGRASRRSRTIRSWLTLASSAATVNKVPKTALTVGVATVMDAKVVLIIVNGHNKARALQHAIEEGINHIWTISALQMHQNGIIVCDEQATIELEGRDGKLLQGHRSANLDPATLLAHAS